MFQEKGVSYGGRLFPSFPCGTEEGTAKVLRPEVKALSLTYGRHNPHSIPVPRPRGS